MSQSLKMIAFVGVAALAAGVAIAQEEAQPTPEQTAVQMRQRHMYLHAFNMGMLGPMAQGEMEYDAAKAQAAADNILNLSEVLVASGPYYWLPGTSTEEMPEDTRALPAIWENMEDFNAKATALQEAATALQAAAGTDLAGLQGAMGPVGEACGGCHEDYRQPEEE